MRAPRVPAVVLVLAAVVSVQFGGAVAATLLPRVGVSGSVTLRLVLASLMLLVLVRPRVRGHAPRDWATVAIFGSTLALMNLCFYAALHRLPIGVAVTVEFVGPLALAAVSSRRPRDLVAVVVAALGVVLISGVGPSGVERSDPVGLMFALGAGAAWAGYIVASRRTGARFPKLDGLALAMTVAACLVTPVGVATAGASLLDPEVVLRGLGIAVLSSVLPYSLELVALRRMGTRTFGVLLSLEPAVAALAGVVVLGQLLGPAQIAGMAAVVLASTAVTASDPSATSDP